VEELAVYWCCDKKKKEKDGLFDFAPFTFLVLLLLLALTAGEADFVAFCSLRNYTHEHVCDGAIPTTCHSQPAR
jgi:hypothetical protein